MVAHTERMEEYGKSHREIEIENKREGERKSKSKNHPLSHKQQLKHIRHSCSTYKPYTRNKAVIEIVPAEQPHSTHINFSYLFEKFS